MFKKNYTVGLATPSSPADGDQWVPSNAGPAESWDYTGTSGSRSMDVEQIVCAVNIFGQDKVYRYGTAAGGGMYNALCLDSKRKGFGADGKKTANHLSPHRGDNEISTANSFQGLHTHLLVHRAVW